MIHTGSHRSSRDSRRSTGAGALNVAFDPVKRLAYVTNRGAGTLTVVDPDGTIQWASVNGLNVGRNPQEVLRVLDALQTDELCPCNWNKGEQTISAHTHLRLRLRPGVPPGVLSTAHISLAGLS